MENQQETFNMCTKLQCVDSCIAIYSFKTWTDTYELFKLWNFVIQIYILWDSLPLLKIQGFIPVFWISAQNYGSLSWSLVIEVERLKPSALSHSS